MKVLMSIVASAASMAASQTSSAVSPSGSGVTVDACGWAGIGGMAIVSGFPRDTPLTCLDVFPNSFTTPQLASRAHTTAPTTSRDAVRLTPRLNMRHPSDRHLRHL